MTFYLRLLMMSQSFQHDQIDLLDVWLCIHVSKVHLSNFPRFFGVSVQIFLNAWEERIIWNAIIYILYIIYMINLFI